MPGTRKPVGICAWFHETILNKFYRVAFRKKIYEDLESLQVGLYEHASIIITATKVSTPGPYTSDG